jgi:hypothetical protein
MNLSQSKSRFVWRDDLLVTLHCAAALPLCWSFRVSALRPK